MATHSSQDLLKIHPITKKKKKKTKVSLVYNTKRYEKYTF